MRQQDDHEAAGRLRRYHVAPSRHVPGLAEDARAGLLERPRSLPPKYFYDDRGSRLFDRICDTPEYYPTRVEAGLLEAHAADVLDAARPAHIIELGSGTSRKTRYLLAAAERLRPTPEYWPFDVSETTLIEAGEELLERFGWLTVNVLVGDYNGGLGNVPLPGGPRLWVFLGGTVGNFTHAEAVDFLREIRSGAGPGDRLLLGADRVKDPAVLRAAYDDAEGVTAEFNRNVLRVLNRELNADFDLAGFRHEAVYNDAERRIEMHLVAEAAQRVRLGALDAGLDLPRGERILTEISRKFTPEGLEALLGEGGFALVEHYQPEDGAFSLVLAEPV